MVKAHVGDYVNIYGQVLRIVVVLNLNGQPTYELENGWVIGNQDFDYDDLRVGLD